jgi:hypothetical protein
MPHQLLSFINSMQSWFDFKKGEIPQKGDSTYPIYGMPKK